LSRISPINYWGNVKPLLADRQGLYKAQKSDTATGPIPWHQ